MVGSALRRTPTPTWLEWVKNGRSDWIRTSDPHTPSVMRYQAALRSDPGAM
jgi:hypothetical protein